MWWCKNQDNREHDILDPTTIISFKRYDNAVTTLVWQAPSVINSDHSNPSSPKIRTLKEELIVSFRSRVIDPKMVEAIKLMVTKAAV